MISGVAPSFAFTALFLSSVCGSSFLTEADQLLLIRRELQRHRGGLTLDASDPHYGTDKVKDGYCSDWQEGSSVRELGLTNSYFKGEGTVGLTQHECWAKCDEDQACEQSVYDAITQECWLGTNAMATDPTAKASNTCYAKNGFGYQLNLDVKDGFCNDFEEGWGGNAPQQCDLEATTVESQQHCSHWGAEYDLSERGCWVKCQQNSACKQAVYEETQTAGVFTCRIGTNVMTGVPGASRYTNLLGVAHETKCYAKDGFGGAGNSTVASGN